ncbi:glutathione S-transferase [Pseudoxanthomonas kalamensis DSM 18571]|uniref:glutathione S-transferase family protein n=1 Tax=Pseudoxanthomonas kalamensis TaxID=289483 RepID=UPI0013910FD4|nr:glutathione S-transferase N-terminal domain-containing protein [Pseudoxanthomonas kalamensis]KAF1711473.1 glutathione S-transferase [Pseudoxanthomonas kalamensis DSM 18571]
MSSLQYRLFYSPGACSLASHIVLEELGVAYEAVRAEIAKGEHRTEEYLAINSRGRVPALVIDPGQDQRVLTESLAILAYLGQKHVEAGLLPSDPELFARSLEWMSWLASNLHQTGIRAVLRPDRFARDPVVIEGIAEQGRALAVESYRDIEARLPKQGHALGGNFSVVDAYLLVFYRWGNRIGLDMWKDYPRYSTLMDIVHSRPAVKRIVEREGIRIDG